MTTPFNLVGELQEENERSGNWCFAIRSPYICRSVLKSFRHTWPAQMCHTCFLATIFVRKKKPLSCQAFSEKVLSRQALLLVGPLPGRVFTEKYKFYWRLLFPWHRCTVFSQTFSQCYLMVFFPVEFLIVWLDSAFSWQLTAFNCCTCHLFLGQGNNFGEVWNARFCIGPHQRLVYYTSFSRY